jgi:alpha-beta hydrolase superfamily lysophospholipase
LLSRILVQSFDKRDRTEFNWIISRFSKGEEMVAGYAKLDQPAVLQVLFHPRREETPPPPGALDLTIRVADSISLGARFFSAREAATVPNILFFHGNGEVVSDYDEIGLGFAEAGINFLAVDYRGYGRSDGHPAATTMLADAHAVLEEVRSWLAAAGHGGPLLVMCRSLGSAPAIELMASHQEVLAGLIIDSGFSLTMPLLECLGVDVQALNLTEADGFKNQLKIAQVLKPTYILHGQFDQIIPVASAEELQAQCGARNKEFSVVPGADHNDLFERAGRLYFEVIRRFIGKALQPSRPRRSGIRNN